MYICNFYVRLLLCTPFHVSSNVFHSTAVNIKRVPKLIIKNTARSLNNIYTHIQQNTHFNARTQLVHTCLKNIMLHCMYLSVSTGTPTTLFMVTLCKLVDMVNRTARPKEWGCGPPSTFRIIILVNSICDSDAEGGRVVGENTTRSVSYGS